MLDWCEIGPAKTHRNEFLSEFLNSQGIPNQFTFVEATPENLGEKIAEVQAQKKVIRFHPKFIDKISGHIAKNLKELETFKTIDCLIYNEARGYWPEIIFKDAFFEYLTSRVKNLDVMQKAFIIGDCGLARACVAALVKLGFSKINITGSSDKGAQDLIQDFKEIFYNVQFEFTKSNDITILAGAHGLVVNTFSPLDSQGFPNEIYYFNFLKKGGLAIDLIDIPPETPFTRIAQDIGAQVVQGYEVFATCDLLWTEKVSGKKILSETTKQAYTDMLKINLEKVPYDKEKLQKILDEFQI